VDDDQTASKVLDIMMKEKTGRVTFMPLNRLKPKNPPLPNAQDAIPLLDKLRFDGAHTKAFQQVFGKTCVCRDLTVAAAYVKSHGVNTITIDGDRVDRKGSLTGGYHDARRSRIEAIKSVAAWRSRYEVDSARAREVEAEILKTDQEVTRLNGRVQVLVAQQTQARDTREGVAGEVMALTKEADRLKERIARLEGQVEEGEGELAALKARLAGLRSELRSPMQRNLTDEEEEALETLNKEVDQRKKRLVELAKTRNEVNVMPERHEDVLSSKICSWVDVKT
jgi:structural maintenance of chromosome 3 (chondroitin sulfate proteoglycan 6)